MYSKLVHPGMRVVTPSYWPLSTSLICLSPAQFTLCAKKFRIVYLCGCIDWIVFFKVHSSFGSEGFCLFSLGMISSLAIFCSSYLRIRNKQLDIMRHPPAFHLASTLAGCRRNWPPTSMAYHRPAWPRKVKPKKAADRCNAISQASLTILNHGLLQLMIATWSLTICNELSKIIKYLN